eukprot:10881511-Prorocentrum_lima.AAC.1
MTSSLVGSEMCIRDRLRSVQLDAPAADVWILRKLPGMADDNSTREILNCLLYTSDAADDM